MERPRPGRHAALLGATASGKSALALALARRDPSWELVTVDSMQVYRGMDIGTAKPTRAERAEVPHHLLDVAEPTEDYDLTRFQADATAAISQIEARGRRALLVGGTALYLRVVVDRLTVPGRFPEVRAELDTDPDTVGLHRRLARLDPVAAARMEPTNRRRVLRALEVTLGGGRPFSSFGPGLDEHPETPFRMVGVRRPMTVLDERIERRYGEMMAAGFLAEVEALAPRGLSRTAAQALGYRELLAHLAGQLTLAEAVELAVRRTRRFARRQRSWFRRDPRITWLDLADARSDPVTELAAALRAGV